MHEPRVMPPRRYRLYGWIIGILVSNFVCFVIVASIIGGDAWNGKSEGSRYFLYGYNFSEGTKGYWEVSRSLFRYSWWHVASVLTTWPIVLILSWRQQRIQKQIRI